MDSNDVLDIYTPRGNWAWNRKRWGDIATWTGDDNWGYCYSQPGKGTEGAGGFACIADRLLHPYLRGYDLDIVEIGCGAGRLTAELVRRASRIRLLDIAPAGIELCRDRFKWFSGLETFLLTECDLSCLAARPCDVIASYDTFVHIHPDLIEQYVSQFESHLTDGGMAWIDHSGKGARSSGNRTAMTAAKMRALASKYGLTVTKQIMRNDWDCITVMEKAKSCK